MKGKKETIACYILSEQYATELYINRKGFLTRGSLTMIDFSGQKTVCRKFLCFSQSDDKVVKASNNHCKIEIEHKHGLCRMVGHVDNFVKGECLLMDVSLTPLPEREGGNGHRVSFFLVSGSLMIGEQEYLFAHAHSGAVLLQSCRLQENAESCVFFGSAQGKTVAYCSADDISTLYWNGKRYALHSCVGLPHGFETADGKLRMILNSPVIQKKENNGSMGSWGHFDGEVFDGEVLLSPHERVAVHRVTGLMKRA